MHRCCQMRGFLRFIVLKMIDKQDMSGEDISKEIERRKGSKPSPGTNSWALLFIVNVRKNMTALGKNITKLFWINAFNSTGFHLVVYTLFILSKKKRNYICAFLNLISLVVFFL